MRNAECPLCGSPMTEEKIITSGNEVIKGWTCEHCYFSMDERTQHDADYIMREIIAYEDETHEDD